MQEKIKEARRLYPLNKIELKICLTVFTILAFGILLSLYTQDWHYFERAGSLVVIVGTVIAWWDITGNIDRYIDNEKAQITSELKNFDKHQDNFMTDTAINNIKNMRRSHSDELLEYAAIRKIRHRTIEALVLVFGTFIWGYGEIIGNYIHEFT